MPESKEQKSEPGLRYDAGKLRYDLIPPEALDELARVYTVGAAKYADRNWERGMSWGRCFGALMRHAWAFWRGEAEDPETKCHHMAHVAWNAFALFVYNHNRVGQDDRFLPQTEEEKRTVDMAKKLAPPPPLSMKHSDIRA